MNLNVIRQLTLRAKSEGYAETTAAAKGLQTAMDGVNKSAEAQATVADAAAKRQLSLADAVSKAERQFVQANAAFVAANDNVGRSFASSGDAMNGFNTIAGTFSANLSTISRDGRTLTEVFLRPMKNVVLDNTIAWALWRTGLIATLPEVNRFSGSLLTNTIQMERLGLQGGQITGVLKKMGDDFVQIQSPMRQGITITGQFALTTQVLAQQFGRLAPQAQQAAAAIQLFSAGGLISAIIIAGAAAAAAASKYGDSLVTLGQRASFAEINLATYQATQRALATAGGLSEDKFASGAEAIAKNLFEAGRAETQLTKLLEVNNVQFKEGEKVTLTTVDAIKVMADLIKHATSGAQQLRIAQAFGVDREWIAAVDRGGDALQKLIDKGSEYATLVDQEMINKAKNFSEAWRSGTTTALNYLKSWANDAIEEIKRFEQESGFFDKMWKNLSLTLQEVKDNWEIVKKFGITDNPETQSAAHKQAIAELRERYRSLRANIDEQSELNKLASQVGDPFGIPPGGVPSYKGIGTTKDAPAETKTAAAEFDRLTASIERSTAATEANAIAVGKGAAETARLRTEARLTEAAQQDIVKNGGNIDDYADRIKKLADRAGEAAAALAKTQIASQIKFDRDTMFLSDEDRKIAQSLVSIYGTDVPKALASSEAAAMRFNDVLRSIRDTTQQFAQTLVSGLLQGKSLTESLKASFDALAQGMATSAIQSLMTGDFLGAAIKGTIAIGAKFIGGALDDKAEKERQKALEEARQAFARMKDQVDDFVTSARGFDLSPVARGLRDIVNEAGRLMDAARAAGDVGAQARINAAYGQQLIRTITDFINPQTELGDLASRIRDVQRSAEDLIQQFILMGNGSDLLAKALRDGAGKQIEALRHQAELSVQASINDAQGRGFINQMNDLLAKIADLQSSGVSQQLLNTDLAVEAQAIVDSANLTGDAFNELLTLFPNLTGVVHESTSALQDQIDAQRRLQEQVNSAVRGIVDFVNSFRVGPESTLSPSARLAQAQSTFNAQYALAQGGNIDALGGITKYSDDLIKALRDNKASGASGEIDHILNQLLALPAVVGSSDPVVQALNRIADHQEAVFFDDMADSAVQTLAQSQTQTSLLTQILSTLSQLNLISITIAQGVGATAASTAAAEQARQAAEAAAAAAAQAAAATAFQNALDQQRYNLAMTQYLAYADQEQWSLQEILQSSPHARTFGPNVVPRPGFPLATGGRISGPGGPFDDTAGLFRLSNGEGVVNAGAMRAFDTMHPRLFDDYINRGRLPANDNGWQSVVTELRALRTENSVMQAQIAALIAKGDKSNVDAIERQSRNSQSDARDMSGKQQARQRRRVANG